MAREQSPSGQIIRFTPISMSYRPSKLEHKYRAVKDKLPKKVDIAEWDEKKLHGLIRFVDFFTEGDKFSVTAEKRKEVEYIDDPYFQEFLARINRPWGKRTNQEFQMRFLTMSRVVLGFIKSNPHLVTEEMKETMEKNKRMQWALNAFRSEITDIGAGTIVTNNFENLSPAVSNKSPAQTNPTLPEVQYNQAIMNMASALNDLTRGLKKSEMQKMKIEDKVRLANQMLSTLQKTFSQYKPNVQVFKQLSIHNASREDLERAFSDYNQQQ